MSRVGGRSHFSSAVAVLRQVCAGLQAEASAQPGPRGSLCQDQKVGGADQGEKRKCQRLLHFRSHGYLQTRSAMQSDERSCWNYPPSRYTRQRHPRTRFSGLLDLTGLIWSGCTLRTWTYGTPSSPNLLPSTSMCFSHWM